MKLPILALAGSLALAALTAAPAAQARPYHHRLVRVCRTSFHHHHRVRVCRMVRR